jgi:predicted exporter
MLVGMPLSDCMGGMVSLLLMVVVVVVVVGVVLVWVKDKIRIKTGLLAFMYSAKQPMRNSCRQWNDKTTIYPLHIRFLSVF